MTRRPDIHEQYKLGNDVINFVVYKSTTAPGYDEVLQHKLLGTTETAHVTLHHVGEPNFHEEPFSKGELRKALRNDLQGYSPAASERLKDFLRKIRLRA